MVKRRGDGYPEGIDVASEGDKAGLTTGMQMFHISVRALGGDVFTLDVASTAQVKELAYGVLQHGPPKRPEVASHAVSLLRFVLLHVEHMTPVSLYIVTDQGCEERTCSCTLYPSCLESVN